MYLYNSIDMRGLSPFLTFSQFLYQDVLHPNPSLSQLPAASDLFGAKTEQSATSEE